VTYSKLEAEDKTTESNTDYDTVYESESDIDVNNNVVRTKSTVCLILNKVMTTYPDGKIEVSRNSEILYSEDLKPEEVDFQSVASEVLEEENDNFREGNIRVMKGDFTL
jgi:hypothetical protein